MRMKTANPIRVGESCLALEYAIDTQIYLPMFMACVNANRLLKGLKLRSRGGWGWR